VPTQRGGAQWRKSSVQTAAGYRRRSRTKDVDDLPIVEKRPSRPGNGSPGAGTEKSGSAPGANVR
jgi:hypothetical protein